MTSKTVAAVYICGGDTTPGPRSACSNTLHDWPLPAGYNDASDVAMSRLSHGWSNTRCLDCGLYGWRQGRPTPHNDTRIGVTP